MKGKEVFLASTFLLSAAALSACNKQPKKTPPTENQPQVETLIDVQKRQNPESFEIDFDLFFQQLFIDGKGQVQVQDGQNELSVTFDIAYQKYGGPAVISLAKKFEGDKVASRYLYLTYFEEGTYSVLKHTGQYPMWDAPLQKKGHLLTKDDWQQMLSTVKSDYQEALSGNSLPGRSE